MSNLATVTHLRPSQRPVERRVAEVEDGYTRLANALYEELIGADLTKNQSKVPTPYAVKHTDTVKRWIASLIVS